MSPRRAPTVYLLITLASMLWAGLQPNHKQELESHAAALLEVSWDVLGPGTGPQATSSPL